MTAISPAIALHRLVLSHCMLASGFELISLADTQPLSEVAAPESSDDGLDPFDFLSQSHVSYNHTTPSNPVEEPLEITPTTLRTADQSGRGASTPRLPTSVPLSRANSAHDNLFASVISTMGDSVGDSFGADSFVFLPPFATLTTSNESQSPLVFLQTQQETLSAELRRHIRDHWALLSEGDDCTGIRATLAGDWARLSESCVLLHEMCVREQSTVESLLLDFDRWDRRRTKVLRHIQQIKSDSSKYGTKLAGLLTRKLDVDNEVEALEMRIAALKAQRNVINKEIRETSSVLESKSAKYVNMFRELEQKGLDVITDYLSSSGVRGQDLQLLLKSEPVNATFSMAALNQATARGSPPTLLGSTLPVTALPALISPNPAHISTQPLEIPEPPAPLSPYAQGYANGSHHLERIKQSINGFVHGMVRQENPPPKEKVDDILNTITEKINVTPILDILRHKIEALEDMSLRTSRLSAMYNSQCSAWNDVCKQLEPQEKVLLQLLNDPTTHPDQLVDRLKVTFGILKQEFQRASSDHTAILKENSLAIVIHQELKAVAAAIDLLVGGDSNIQTVESLSKDSTTPKLNRDRLSMRITSAGYHPSPKPTLMTARVNSSNIQDSVFAPRSKNMKSE